MEYTTPQGFRDVLADEAVARESMVRRVQGLMAEHGFVPIETPTLENMDVMQAGGRVPNSPFKFFDAQGSLVTMRPDVTLQVARMCATRLRGVDGPFKFRYIQRVFRESEGQVSADVREKKQIGIEYIGASGPEVDAEVIGLFIQALETAGVQKFKLSLATVGVLRSLLAKSGAPRRWKSAVLESFHKSDFVEIDRLCEEAMGEGAAGGGAAGGAAGTAGAAGGAGGAGATGAGAASGYAEYAAAIAELARVRGGAEAIQEARELVEPLGCAGALDDFEKTYELLAKQGVADRILIDFSVMSSFDYYTGIVFEAYADRLGTPLGSGGRYDKLLAQFGDDRAAAGFAFYIEEAQAAIAAAAGESAGGAGAGQAGEGAGGAGAGQAVEGAGGAGADAGDSASSARRPLRIAVPKGSLNADAIEVLGAAGLDVTGLDEPGRTLIIRNEGVDYIIVRPSDAPIFVEMGAADCGICGEDSLLESGADVVQLVDLRFGACRFIVAEPDGAAERNAEHYRKLGSIRVATKYPRIARQHFARRGVQVEIVQLHGNIELGPLTDLAECIVDITATGTTLRENNLVITDEVMDSTARFFGNVCSLRTDERVRALAAKLREQVAGRSLKVTAGGEGK